MKVSEKKADRWKEVINAFFNNRALVKKTDSCEVNFSTGSVMLRHKGHLYALKRGEFIDVVVYMTWPHHVKYAVACRVNYLGSKLGFDREIFFISENHVINLRGQETADVITLTFPLDITSYDEWMAYQMMVQE